MDDKIKGFLYYLGLAIGLLAIGILLYGIIISF